MKPSGPASATPSDQSGETGTVAASAVGGSDGPGEEEAPTALAPTDAGDGLTLGTYRDLWASETTDLSPALNYLIPAQRLELSIPDADRLGLDRGDEVAVRSDEAEVTAHVAIRAALPEGTCFLMEGTREGNANLFANGRPAVVEIGKAVPSLDVIAGNGGQG